MTELQPTRENDARVAETKHYSKAGLYGCLACDCEGCLDADCYPGAERVTVEKARELGWELTLHVFSDGNGWAKFHKPGCRPNYEEVGKTCTSLR